MGGPRPELSEETACNLCGGRDYEPIGNVDRDGKPLRTTICRRCGLVWTNPRPSREDVNRYYATRYRTDYQKSSAPTLRKVLRGVIGAVDRKRSLLPLLRPGSRVLDVGCGAGEFVYLLRTSGLEASGLEPDEQFAAFSRDTLAIPVQTGTVESASVAPDSFDMVTMFHALEHVADPLGTMQRIRGWLKPEGLLVVEVPNVDARCQAPRHRFHYAHLYSFSSGTLSALGARAGLTPIKRWLSEDGGNITCVFRRDSRNDSAPDAMTASGVYERTRQIIKTHATVRHYLSPTPYRRALQRALRRIREDRLLRQLRTIDAVMKWGESG
jgi:2-polyprenyl-3-methyl-5-hydroxy-6-metoxy-1,4-benzoquinol methylase